MLMLGIVKCSQCSFHLSHESLFLVWRKSNWFLTRNTCETSLLLRLLYHLHLRFRVQEHARFVIIFSSVSDHSCSDLEASANVVSCIQSFTNVWLSKSMSVDLRRLIPLNFRGTIEPSWTELRWVQLKLSWPELLWADAGNSQHRCFRVNFNAQIFNFNAHVFDCCKLQRS